jgi:hypothetical protein
MNMRILKTLVVLGLCVVALGFYRGWLSLGSKDRDTESNTVDVTLTVDPDKIKEDVTKVSDETSEPGNESTEEATPDTEQQNTIEQKDESHIQANIRT